jgi:hypothetical protein
VHCSGYDDGQPNAEYDRHASGFVACVLQRLIPTSGRFESLQAEAKGHEQRDEPFAEVKTQGAHHTTRIGRCLGDDAMIQALEEWRDQEGAAASVRGLRESRPWTASSGDASSA